jgi:PAS domain S-box-containing protein
VELGAHHDPINAAETAATSAVRDLDATLARVWLVDPDAPVGLTLAASAGAAAGPGVEPSRLAALARSRQALVTNDPLREPGVNRDLVASERLRALAALPLFAGDEVLGVLVTFFAEPLAGGTAELLQAFAASLAAALHESGLLAREQRARARVESSEQRFQTLAEGIDHAIVWEADAATMAFTFVSARSTPRLLGVSREAWLRDPAFWEAHLHPADRALVQAALARALETGKDLAFDHRMLHEDGATLWVHTGVRVLRDQASGRATFLGLTVDVSHLKRATERQAAVARGEALRADVSAALVEAHDLDAMLRRCAQALARDLRVASAGFWLLEADADDVLVLRASAGAPLDPARARVPVGQQEVGRVAATRRPTLERDAVQFAGAPLVADGRVVGVIALFAEDPLADETLDALRSIADAIAQGVQRLRAVAARQEGEARLRLALEATGLGAWEWDPRESALRATARAVALLGLAGQRRPTLAHVLEALHPDDRAEVDRAFARALDPAGTGELAVEARTRAPLRWLALRGQALFAEGEALRVLGTVLDVTEPRRAAADARFLAEAGRQLARSLDYDVTLRRVARLAVPYLADYCVVDLLDDDDGGPPRLVAAADRERSVEDAVHEYRGRHPFDPAAPQGVARVLRTGVLERVTVDPAWLDATAAGDAGRRGELEAMQLASYMVLPLAVRGRSLGAITFATSLAQSARRYGADDEALAEELARRVALAIDNARLYREAQRAIRARDEFLSIASHELRTPLTPLQLQVQSLRRMLSRPAGVAPEALAAKVEVAERQVERLGALVSNLLDISRITARRLGLELEQVDLTEVVREVALRSSEQLRRAGCELALDAEAPLVGRWDRLRLEQVVTNLLHNAMKYGAGKPIALTVSAEGDQARLVVRDQGIGIAPKDQRRIFLRFERAVSERHYGGFGLGLWISRQIVEAMGGTIGVQSALGRGATFTVRLPRGAR